MLGRDVLISWVRNIPWSSQKTKDFRREIIWDFFSSIWDFFAIFCQASRYRARFQASSGHSDSANSNWAKRLEVMSEIQAKETGDRSIVSSVSFCPFSQWLSLH